MTLKNYVEFKEAEAAWMNNKPYKGVGGYELEKALADYAGGVNRINPDSHGQAFEKAVFTGKTSSATIRSMDTKPRR